MRPARTLVALALVALLVPVVPASSHVETLSCEPPSSAFGLAVVLPCTARGVVTTGFQVRVLAFEGTVGPALVDAVGPDGTHLLVACPFAAVVAACGPPVATGPAFVGAWSFTLRPAASDVNGGAWMRLEVDAW